MNESKNNYFECELEIKTLDKELKNIRIKYMTAHKENLKLK